MLRAGAWRRAVSGLTRAQERAFGVASTAPAQGLDASLPEVSENHKGPTGVLQVAIDLQKFGAAPSVMSSWLCSAHVLSGTICWCATYITIIECTLCVQTSLQASSRSPPKVSYQVLALKESIACL